MRLFSSQGHTEKVQIEQSLEYEDLANVLLLFQVFAELPNSTLIFSGYTRIRFIYHVNSIIGLTVICRNVLPTFFFHSSVYLHA